jgi:hypothetical protein
LARNPIDLFILARLHEQGLAPLPPADPVVLIRRVTFDLVGLPPTPQEVDAFRWDASPDAYEELVDRLLGSHAYGERWAQHWLDLARFAESDGFELDQVRPSAWRYRDWVIQALNGDMPYDRFIQYQLAGDELFPEEGQPCVSTSFCLSGPDMPDINSQEERRHELLNEMTGTVGAVFLALQIGCAQCHDHKFDPISQGDFYRLRAVFEPAVHVEPKQSVSVLQEHPGPVRTSHLMIRGDWRRPGPIVFPAFPRIANPWDDAVGQGEASRVTSGRRAALARWLTRADHPLTTRVIVNRLWQYHFGQGLSTTPSDFGLMGDVPSHPELLDWLATELIRQGWSLKRMHRLIVTSETYRRASLPSVPGWSDERLRVAKQQWDDAKRVDPDNRLLARFPRWRLEGEAIRDAMLAAADRLSARCGGPGVMPPLPEELISTLLKDQWNQSADAEAHCRRSVYVFVRRNLRYPIFEAFDRPDANQSCPRRSRSTTAPQSLLMLNSEMSLELARHLAGDVLGRAGPSPDDWIALAFRRTLSRDPTAQEIETAREFLHQQARRLDSEHRTSDRLALPLPLPTDVPPHLGAAMTDLCLGLFNTSEFVYVD